MSGALEWLNGISGSWWTYFLNAGWQAAVAGSVLLVVVHFLGRRWPAPLRYALLVLALLKFACPPLLPFPTGLFTHISPPTVVLPLVQERKPAQAGEPQFEGSAGASGRVARWRLEMGGWVGRVQWPVWFMAFHALGTVGLVFSVSRQARRLRALARGARLVRGGVIPSEQYRDLSIQLGLYRIPSLAVSEEVPGPLAYGAKKPTIMLPTKILERLTLGELRAVLAHEFAHCQRGDLWLNWIQVLLAALWWFHPVLWLLNRSLRDVREDCCDDLLLVRGVISNDAYCDVLLRAASTGASRMRLATALGLGGPIHPLGRRLARITDWSLRRAEGVSVWGAAVVLMAAALLLPGASGVATNRGALPQERARPALAQSEVVTADRAPARTPSFLMLSSSLPSPRFRAAGRAAELKQLARSELPENVNRPVAVSSIAAAHVGSLPRRSQVQQAPFVMGAPYVHPRWSVERPVWFKQGHRTLVPRPGVGLIPTAHWVGAPCWVMRVVPAETSISPKGPWPRPKA